jgi:hypothetical protein
MSPNEACLPLLSSAGLTYGCPRCRHSPKGCSTCRRPGYKRRRNHQVPCSKKAVRKNAVRKRVTKHEIHKPLDEDDAVEPTEEIQGSEEEDAVEPTEEVQGPEDAVEPELNSDKEEFIHLIQKNVSPTVLPEKCHFRTLETLGAVKHYLYSDINNLLSTVLGITIYDPRIQAVEVMDVFTKSAEITFVDEETALHVFRGLTKKAGYDEITCHDKSIIMHEIPRTHAYSLEWIDSNMNIDEWETRKLFTERAFYVLPPEFFTEEDSHLDDETPYILNLSRQSDRHIVGDSIMNDFNTILAQVGNDLSDPALINPSFISVDSFECRSVEVWFETLHAAKLAQIMLNRSAWIRAARIRAVSPIREVVKGYSFAFHNVPVMKKISSEFFGCLSLFNFDLYILLNSGNAMLVNDCE